MTKNRRPNASERERNRRKSTNDRDLRKTNVAGPHFLPPPPSPQVLQGVAALQAGKWDEAEASFHAALGSNGSDTLALNCLGIVSRARGDHSRAFELFSLAIAINPAFAEAHTNLGNVLWQQGKFVEAVESYKTAIRLKPAFMEARNGLGNALMSLGHWDQAEQSLREAVSLNPRSAEAQNNLGNVLREKGQFDDARAALEAALALAPRGAEILHNLALVLRDQGELGEARARCEACLSLAPQFAEAWGTLGSCLIPLGDPVQAAECFEKAAKLRPLSVTAQINLHNAVRPLDLMEKATAACERLIQLQPEEPLHAIRRSTVWPAVFSDSAAMYDFAANRLSEWQSRRGVSAAVDGARWTDLVCEAPFNLQFGAGNVRPIKEAYAQIFSETMRKFSEPLEMIAARKQILQRSMRGSRGRVGWVVTRGHEGIFIKSMAGVLRRLNPDAAETLVFCPRATAARMVADLQAPQVRVTPLPNRFDQIADAVSAEACDSLMYWEIGTDATNYFLPFLRLAPVQGTSWGVQVTSGIPNVDFYLSSRCVEPADAANHYSEKLLLADTLLTYQSPAILPKSLRSRESFGFTNQQHLYVCAQQLGKFHPDFDEVLAGILRGDPAGVVVVTQDRGAVSSQRLRERWARTINDVAERIVFVPRLESADYFSLLAAADVLLDPLHFGGVNSTYDGLSLGKAIITLPSAYHRGRYTFGCYQRMELLDCVASSTDDYVQRAIRIGTDAEFRKQIEAKIAVARPRIFNDTLAVQEHERLVQQLLIAAQK